MKPTPIRLLSRKFGCHALVVVFLACLLPLVVLSEERVGWKTSRIHGTPDPELPFQVKKRFPKLRFKEPVDLEQIPGTERLAILELSGKLSSFANNDQASVGSALELKKQSFGIAFHPQFEKNHLLFISYVLKDGDTNGTHLSQFTASSVDPLVVDPKSEKLILTWPGGGHNGGSLQFGNEGFLYISTGDGANPNPPDPYNTGQDLRDLLGSILRIDVDHPSNGSAYGIPSDNPFIKTTGARPEIWAFGLRNPWRMSFDKPTGNLWVGDVGWELWEMIYKVERGGNYGWSIMEGPQHLRNDLKEGPAPVSPPVISHPHTEGASITGGYVYHGRKLSTLNNLYIYGDWISGRIWSLEYESGKMVSHSQIAATSLNIICFGQDKNGELLVVDYGGEIYELEPNPAFGKPSQFPVKLSDTGLFISTKTLTSSPGVYSYSVQAEMWMDNSTAQRWIAIPEAGSVSKNNEGKWIYPPETVFVRTVFSTNQTHSEKGDKRIETQLLHLSGTQWKGYSYRWNDAQDDADLIPAEGIEQEADPSKENHSSLNNWHFSSRAECMRCHSYSFSPVLGFSAIQLSGRNELARLKEVKILPPELVPDSGARLVNPYQSELNLNARARSWLHVNCGHCHREGAGGSVPAHFNFELKRDEMKSVDVKPTQGNFDLPDARIIAPGAPNHSALIYRISSLGPSHMPRVGPTTLDTRGLNLIWDWILAGADDKNSAEDNSHKTTEGLELATSRDLKNPVDKSTAEFKSPAEALMLIHSLETEAITGAAREQIIRQGRENANPLIRDLFERYVPLNEKKKKLGSDFNPETVLKLSGDVLRGRKLFMEGTVLQCSQCHQIEGKGRNFGPDLSHIGSKYDNRQLLENILFPSKVIEPAFISYQVETKDEQSFAGFLISSNATELTIRDSNLENHKIPATSVIKVEPSRLSSMPEGLLQAISAQEACDLLAFLASLK